MKRLFALLTAFVLVISTLSLSAFAAEVPEVIDDIEPIEGIDSTAEIIGCDSVSNSFIMRSNDDRYKDLADGNFGIYWTLGAESTAYNYYRYKTNTTRILIHLVGDVNVSLTVRLYNEAGSVVGTITKNVGTIFGSNFEFTNLTASEYYHYSITNNGQQDVTFGNSSYISD